MTSNSGHEETKNAIKSGPSCVRPQHGLDKSVKVQVDHDSHNLDLHKRHMTSALFGRLTWSNSPTVNVVTLPAEFMLKFSIDESEKYASWRTSPYKWLVVWSVDSDMKSLIPSFHRVYTVITQGVDNSVCLMCDCNFYECNGMVCPHSMVHVKKFYASNPIISHHDMSVRWWKSYIYFSMKNESDCSPTEKEIRKKLQELCKNDCNGPNFIDKDDDHSFSPFHRVYKFGKESNDQFKNATECFIVSLFRKLDARDRVINYSRDEIDIALKSAKKSISISMSKEAHFPDQPITNFDDVENAATDDCNVFDDGQHSNVFLDDQDVDNSALIESTTIETDCIDFGIRATLQAYTVDVNHRQQHIQHDYVKSEGTCQSC